MVAPAQPPAITTSPSQGPQQQQQQPGQVSTLTAAIGDLEAVVSDAKRHAEWVDACTLVDWVVGRWVGGWR